MPVWSLGFVARPQVGFAIRGMEPSSDVMAIPDGFDEVPVAVSRICGPASVAEGDIHERKGSSIRILHITLIAGATVLVRLDVLKSF